MTKVIVPLHGTVIVPLHDSGPLKDMLVIVFN